jgi:hypothetical protein
MFKCTRILSVTLLLGNGSTFSTNSSLTLELPTHGRTSERD